MAVAPQFAATIFGSKAARHTLELYLDFVCPFSKKRLLGVREHLVPLVEKDLKDDLSIVIRSTPQPWHGSSTYVHEAFLAVVKEAPEKAWPFAYALMEKQAEYFDEPVYNETVKDTKKRLAKLAKESVGLDEDKIYSLIANGKGNGGSAVTNDLKLQVKLGRQNGIHVTPSVVLDGLFDPSVSSSFGAEEWKKFVDEKVRQK